MTEAAWPWPWIGVGVVSDPLEPVAPIRFGEVLAGDVRRPFAVHLVLEGVAMQLIT